MSTTAAGRRTRRWIDDWRPEDPAFWETTGRQVARRNLVWSIFAEHLGFSIWLIWSVGSAFLATIGFNFSTQQLFFLVAIPSLTGALLRIPYTMAVPKFGGRNWTVFSALALLVPTAGFAVAVTQHGTPFWVFCVIAAFAGVGGGNFSSSMTNINFFYPAARKGTALGLNAAGGNIGVAGIQFLLPLLVGGAGAFGLVKAAHGGLHLERAAYVYAGLCVVAAVVAYFRMDNLTVASSTPRQQFSVLRDKQTLIMALLYVGTFGSFMGYSSAMPLLIKLNFWVPKPKPLGTGVYFAYYAFLGAFVGSLTRPLGGWLADKFGGARITLVAFAGMVVSTLAVLWTLTQLQANPHSTAAIAKSNEHWFPAFLVFFMLVFAATGIGNGSTYKMIPGLYRTPAQSSAALGVIGAVGALGGFLIPITFNSPWVHTPLAATKNAFVVFTCYYALCAVLTYFAYARRRKPAAESRPAAVSVPAPATAPPAEVVLEA
jgi:NNP family nitrate/nitrite transporter-like MFS transporter